MQFFLFVAIVILIAFGILTVQNPATVVTITFIRWTFSGPLALILAVPFAAGVVAGIFLFIPTLWKKSRALRSNKKRIQELESELSGIKKLIQTEKSGDESEADETKT